MSTEANQDTGAISVLDAVENMYREPEMDNPDVETEEAPDAEPVESTEEEATEPEEVEAADTDATESDEEPQHLTVDEYGDLTMDATIDGQKQKVTLAELVNGYQRDADYRRKTQALSNERKEFEAERAQALEQINRQQEQIAQLLAENVGEPPDLSLAEDDPYEYTRQKALYDAKVEKATKARREAEQRNAYEMQQRGMREAQILAEKAPEFLDHNFTANLVKTVSETYGIDPQEVMATTDHRVFLMAADALKYRQGIKSNPKVEKVIAKTGKVLKPGAARTSADVEAGKKAAIRKKLAKPGGVSIDEYLRAKFE